MARIMNLMASVTLDLPDAFAPKTPTTGSALSRSPGTSSSATSARSSNARTDSSCRSRMEAWLATANLRSMAGPPLNTGQRTIRAAIWAVSNGSELLLVPVTLL
jgi:hypothetical protein